MSNQFLIRMFFGSCTKQSLYNLILSHTLIRDITGQFSIKHIFYSAKYGQPLSVGMLVVPQNHALSGALTENSRLRILGATGNYF